jgi:hypothetical protein
MRDRTTEQEWTEVETTNKVCLDMADLFDKTQRVLRRRGTTDTLNALIACGGPGLGKHFTIRAAVRAAQRWRRKSPIYLPNRPLKAAEISRVCSSAKYPVIYTHAKPNGAAAWNAIIEALLAANDGRDGYYGCAPLLVSTPLELIDARLFPAGARKAVTYIHEHCGQISFTSTVLERWQYTCWLAITKGLLRKNSKGAVHSVTAQNAALDWFTRHVWRLREVSPRTLLRIMGVVGRVFVGHGAGPSQTVLDRDAALNSLVLPVALWNEGHVPLSPELLQEPRPRAKLGQDSASERSGAGWGSGA